MFPGNQSRQLDGSRHFSSSHHSIRPVKWIPPLYEYLRYISLNKSRIQDLIIEGIEGKERTEQQLELHHANGKFKRNVLINLLRALFNLIVKAHETDAEAVFATADLCNQA